MHEASRLWLKRVARSVRASARLAVSSALAARLSARQYDKSCEHECTRFVCRLSLVRCVMLSKQTAENVLLFAI